MKTECCSCKHKALCNAPSHTALIIQDNELKPNSFQHAKVSAREDFIGTTNPFEKCECGMRADIRKARWKKGWVLTCGCYLGSKWTLRSEYLFRHVFPSWQLFERSVGFSHPQTSEVAIRGAFQRYASQMGLSKYKLAKYSIECVSVCLSLPWQCVHCVIRLSGQHMLVVKWTKKYWNGNKENTVWLHSCFSHVV